MPILFLFTTLPTSFPFSLVFGFKVKENVLTEKKESTNLGIVSTKQEIDCNLSNILFFSHLQTVIKDIWRNTLNC